MHPMLVRRGRLALAAALLALPCVVAEAQVRTPDRVPRARRTVPERRTELTLGVGRQQLEAQNGLSSATILSMGFRRQLRTDWAYLGGRLDVGSTDVEGSFFAPERRTVGDTTRFVSVGQSARWTALWLTGDFLFPFDDDERFRSGFSTGIGAWGLLPSRSPAPGTGNQFGPAAKLGFTGAADLTKRIGVEAGLDGSFYFGIDRDKLRASDPALGDPNIPGPVVPVPEKKDGVNAALRFHVGFTYRLGVRRTER